MTMKKLLTFLVLCLCKFESETRPINSRDVFKLPKPITNESIITINGTMKIQYNVLFLSLLDKQKTSVCNFTYDTTSGKITTSSELTEPVFFDYNLENPNSLVPAEFSLHLEPFEVNQKYLVNLHFDADNAGQLSLDPCEVKDFANIHRILIKGADSISSLLFKYKT